MGGLRGGDLLRNPSPRSPKKSLRQGKTSGFGALTKGINLDTSGRAAYHPRRPADSRSVGSAWKRGSALFGLKASSPMRAIAFAAVLSAFLGAGCVRHPTTLWADSALADGRLSDETHQWVYDGEPVTFELQVVPGAASYVLFEVGNEATVVQAEDIGRQFRWTHTFHAGHEPQEAEVFATPFVVRGRRDWIYDRLEQKWMFYPGADDRRDVPTAEERRMRITCYRREISLEFAAHGGAPKAAGLTLVKANGEQVTIPRSDPARPDARGFLLLGPDDRSLCRVVYVPTHEEVGRAGTTQVNLVVEHADGSAERVQDILDTP
jgi:hypothetical protein